MMASCIFKFHIVYGIKCTTQKELASESFRSNALATTKFNYSIGMCQCWMGRAMLRANLEAIKSKKIR